MTTSQQTALLHLFLYAVVPSQEPHGTACGLRAALFRAAPELDSSAREFLINSNF
jgi:hypothetical protein